jgi:trigger factor
MKLTSDMEKVIAGTEDLAYEMALEVMPTSPRPISRS